MTDRIVEAQARPSAEPIQPEASGTSLDLTMGFHGKPVDSLLVLLKNTLLMIVTFGLYYPWACAARQRYLLNHTTLGPYAFSFSGTGTEIALSCFRSLFLYGLIYAGLFHGSRLSLESPTLGAVVYSMLLILFYACLPFILWSGRAYRVSRTRYRSIYFAVDRRQRNVFFKRYFHDFLLMILTLGFSLPVLIYNVKKNLTHATRWGNVPFQYTASLSDSCRLSIRNFLWCLLSCGLYTPFAWARRVNFDWNHTRVGDKALVRAQITSGDVWALVAVPWLLTALTLGLAYPWVTVWARQRLLQRFSVIGRMDWTRVRQSKDLASAEGQTMSDLWGVDLSMGV